MAFVEELQKSDSNEKGSERSGQKSIKIEEKESNLNN